MKMKNVDPILLGLQEKIKTQQFDGGIFNLMPQAQREA